MPSRVLRVAADGSGRNQRIDTRAYAQHREIVQLNELLLKPMPNINYPGGSKSRVNRAGDAVRNGTATLEDLTVIDTWRAAHRAVLNTFQAILRTQLRDAEVTVAQRHKRRNTIFDKLQRIPGMELSRMDDVAGCRVIFKNAKQLHSFRRTFHRSRFNHKLRNDPDKYNYIEHPKKTGYRSIHDVYPSSDIVLVRADTSAEVKTAFRNYFKDARDFVKLMDTGCAKLGTHHHVEASPTIHDGSKTVKNAPLEHRA